jgi:hypothetical protein
VTKKSFDGIVLVSFLTMVASTALLKAWSRRHLAEGHPGGAGNAAAGTIELSI